MRQAVYERAVLSWPELVGGLERRRCPAGPGGGCLFDHPDALPVSDAGSLRVLTSPEAVLVVVAGAGNAGVSAVVEPLLLVADLLYALGGVLWTVSS